MKIWVVVEIHPWGSAESLGAFTNRDEAINFARTESSIKFKCEIHETTLHGAIGSLINAIKEEVRYDTR